jgi:predicted metal-dependent peptidase
MTLHSDAVAEAQAQVEASRAAAIDKASQTGQGEVWDACLCEARRGFEKSKRYMVRNHPFYASFLLSMEIEWTHTVPIAATDGKKFFFNPVKCKNNTFRQWNFLIAHESIHVAHMHPFRRVKRNPMIWNIAVDYKVNQLLDEHNDFELIKGCLRDKAYDPYSPEQVYPMIEKKVEEAIKNGQGAKGQIGAGDSGGSGGAMPNPDSQTGDGESGHGQGQQGDQKADGNGAPGDGQGDPTLTGAGYSPDGEGNRTVELDIDWLHGDVLDPAHMDEHEREVAMQRAKALTFQAAFYAKAMGNDNELANQVIQSNAPKTGWQLKLSNFVSGVLDKDDYTWARCNRRYVNQGVYLPTLGGTKPPKLMALAIDTSGSINEEQLKKFAEEMSGILAQHPHLKFLTYACNTRIQWRERLSAQDVPLKLKCTAGGGTRYSPVFEDIENEDEPVAGLIYFTDMQCRDYGPEPAYPVVFLNFGAPQILGGEGYQTRYLPPWGSVVNMD